MDRQTKQCPHCGKEILAVAKKCKHCGQWLEEETEASHETPEMPETEKSNANENISGKHNIIISVSAGVVMTITMILFIYGSRQCSNDNAITEISTEVSDGYNTAVSTDVYAEPEAQAPQSSVEEVAAMRYKNKYNEVYCADIHLMRADGRRIWYNYWTSENSSGYENRLYIYDSYTDREIIVNLNKTAMTDDMMQVDDMVEHKGIITIIMSEYRNSNGWVEGTHVWQYNCETGAWKALVKGCSDAEFSKNRNAVKICNADCINPDDPTYLQEYIYNYKTIRL